MIKNKKADLSLSINAIVILILAITMLGLGLTFMRGLFKQATGKVESAVSSQELANPPTIDNPVTLYPIVVELRANEDGKTLLAFMHAEGDSRDCYLKIWDKNGVEVKPETGGTNYGFFMTYNNGKVGGIPPDKIYTWTIAVNPDDATAATKLKADCTPNTIITCPHIYSAKIECYTTAIPPVLPVLTGTYKKDLLIKISS